MIKSTEEHTKWHLGDTVSIGYDFSDSPIVIDTSIDKYYRRGMKATIVEINVPQYGISKSTPCYIRLYFGAAIKDKRADLWMLTEQGWKLQPSRKVLIEKTVVALQGEGMLRYLMNKFH